jgi:hypothetical protein
MRGVEADLFAGRPAERLDDRAFDLIANAVRIDRLAAIDRRNRTRDRDTPAPPLDFDLEG